MNRYAIFTEINCITKKEYWPCGTGNIMRVDKRLSIDNAFLSVEHRKTNSTVRVCIVDGELNRACGLKVRASFPYTEKKNLDFIN